MSGKRFLDIPHEINTPEYRRAWYAKACGKELGEMMIGHCGVFHPVKELPWACPICGTTFGEPELFVQESP